VDLNDPPTAVGGIFACCAKRLNFGLWAMVERFYREAQSTKHQAQFPSVVESL
jgi:hypothetical protein